MSLPRRRVLTKEYVTPLHMPKCRQTCRSNRVAEAPIAVRVVRLVELLPRSSSPTRQWPLRGNLYPRMPWYLVLIHNQHLGSCRLAECTSRMADKGFPCSRQQWHSHIRRRDLRSTGWPMTQNAGSCSCSGFQFWMSNSFDML